MDKAVWKAVGAVLWMALWLASTGPPAGGAEAGRMTIEELKASLGQPGLVVLDVRSEGDWKGSDQKIKGAVREVPGDVKGWAGKYDRDKTLVLYCA